MDKRNWVDLSRKLVDRSDMLYTVGAMSAALGEASLSFFGEGVLPTTQYPTPFPITMSGLVLGGTVGDGVAYDPQGQITEITPSSDGSPDFLVTASDPALDRWDLLVIRYKMTGEQAIPKPSDPILTIFLNLVDDFELAVIPGIPSATPSYPAKGALDIILDGLRVPAGATLGSQVVVDPVPREIASAFRMTRPEFQAEVPAGTVDGVNQTFALSDTPMDADSIIVSLDALAIPSTDWSLVGQNIVFATAPAPGQEVYAWYVVDSPMSQNPLSGQQEVPSGAVNGINDTFSLLGRPADQLSTLVFLDGVLVPKSDWSLLQGALADKIKFEPAAIPVAGQDVYVFYFVNPATVGVAPGGGGGGGGGAYVVSGSIGAPNVIAAAAGVGITADQRQMKFIKSSGGQMLVTANPQVQAGIIVGQELLLIGTDPADSVQLSDGSGLSLNGTCVLDDNASILLVWTGSVWSETSRR